MAPRTSAHSESIDSGGIKYLDSHIQHIS